MIIKKNTPFTKEEIIEVSSEFGGYVKTVIDVERKICVAGMPIHFDGEKMLIEDGSRQSDIWGGGIDLNNRGKVDFNSFINIKPNDNNDSNEILDSKLRESYSNLTKYFFEESNEQ